MDETQKTVSSDLKRSPDDVNSSAQALRTGKTPFRVVLLSLLSIIIIFIILFNIYIFVDTIVWLKHQSISEIVSNLLFWSVFSPLMLLFIPSFAIGVGLTFFFKKARSLYIKSLFIKWIYRALFFTVFIVPLLLYIFIIIQQITRDQNLKNGMYLLGSDAHATYVPFNESGIKIESSLKSIESTSSVSEFQGEETPNPWGNIRSAEGSTEGVIWDSNSDVIELSAKSGASSWIRFLGIASSSLNSLIFDYEFEQQRFDDSMLIIYIDGKKLKIISENFDNFGHVFTSGTQLIGTPGLSPGSHTLGFILKNVKGSSKIKIYNIRVGNIVGPQANVPPMAIVEPPSLEARVGTTIYLNGENSYDPDRYPGFLLHSTWKQVAGPTTTINYAWNKKANFIPTEIGEYSFQYSLNDEYGESNKVDIKFNVAPMIMDSTTASDRPSVLKEQPSTILTTRHVPNVKITSNKKRVSHGEKFFITVDAKSDVLLQQVWWWVAKKDSAGGSTHIRGTLEGKQGQLDIAHDLEVCAGLEICTYSRNISFDEPGTYVIGVNARDALYKSGGFQASEGPASTLSAEVTVY